VKGGQLPDLPPEVKAARDTLAAWLNKQKLFRSRDLHAWDAARKAEEDSDGLLHLMQMDEDYKPPDITVEHTCQDLEVAVNAGQAALWRLVERECTIFQAVRPDLDADECLWLAKLLVHEWTGEKPRAPGPPNWLRKKRRPRGPAPPPGLTDPVQLARSLAQLARDVKRDPESYEEEHRVNALLACQRYLTEAHRVAFSPK